jgi:hypothetical protein
MAVKIDPGSSRAAPFVYADGLSTFGVQNGVLHLELAANTIVPDGAGTKEELLIVGHLRCAPEAARAIRDAIDKMLALPSVEAGMMPMPAASRPN